MSPLPTLFVSHGAPTLAIEPGRTGALLSLLGQRLPRPEAILLISPHWATPQPSVGSLITPTVMHDFSGFPRELYRLDYPAQGSPALAHRTVDALREAGIAATIDPQRGLDHGAWVPLRYLFPEADVPVTQLSLQPHQAPDYHYRVGQALSPLARDGVLVIGSGSFTHNLRELRVQQDRMPGARYVDEFAQWFAERMAAGDLPALLDYRAHAPYAVRAHPGDDHLLPLFIAMGASDDWTLQAHFDTGTTYDVLRMDAFAFGSAALALREIEALVD
ncbi:hypothetical protein PATSB16_31560 [Pandoraea thiooxydans]|uniref:Dioxygenase n=1 Tax=Pandoraea thiooxydans TaxID=445709 RepID=A0A0G3EPI4_9BURK|nr:class III extradiol ring-cleavage dioxygenase [Pandoraea thiooxydans]AKJ68968.1 dioxygenase [Pandoraea thiooxydans]APR96494.1 hypothetical protein PATSB16_31560 [Pandoraea thiooxydans]